jgi:hypothetical protein
MIYDYKTILGVISVVIGFIGYIPYYRDILRRRTKPHPFSWIGFGLLLSISFFAQLVTGAGAGAWVTGISAVGVFGIAILSIYEGEKDITTFDWICFIGALLGIVLWRLTSNPLTAVIIVTIVDAIAFLPTYRKGYLKPQEETASLFAISVLKYAIGIAALATFNLTTVLFPLSLVITNGAFVSLLLLRRRKLGTLSP